MSDVKQIEFVEAPYTQIGTDRWYAGDRKSFPVQQADLYIKLGWAKDPATGEQGERVEGVSDLVVSGVVTPVG